jgi:hypothetical protein
MPLRGKRIMTTTTRIMNRLLRAVSSALAVASGNTAADASSRSAPGQICGMRPPPASGSAAGRFASCTALKPCGGLTVKWSDSIASVAAPVPAQREQIRFTCTWAPWRTRVDEPGCTSVSRILTHTIRFSLILHLQDSRIVLSKQRDIAETSEKSELLTPTAFADTDTRHPSG